MTAIEKVSAAFDRYVKTPLATSAKGEPLLLVQDDHNAQLIAKTMQTNCGENWTLQSVIDLVRDLNFAKQLHWTIQPGHEAPAQQPAPPQPQPQPKRDTRTKEQKLYESGERVYSHRASPQDQAAEIARHDHARNRLKQLFQVASPERAEFNKRLHDIALYTEITHGRVNRTGTYRERERMRNALRQAYPQYADQIITPDSERPDVRF